VFFALREEACSGYVDWVALYQVRLRSAVLLREALTSGFGKLYFDAVIVRIGSL
jgi:hypothetical protein